jgi:hypothetical protein
MTTLERTTGPDAARQRLLKRSVERQAWKLAVIEIASSLRLRNANSVPRDVTEAVHSEEELHAGDQCLKTAITA